MKKTVGILILLITMGHTLMAQKKISLKEAKKIALENNTQIKNARLDVENAESKVWETIAIGLPQITAETKYQNFVELPVTVLPKTFVDPKASPDEVIAIRAGTPQTMNNTVKLNQLLFDGSYIVGVQSTQVYKQISKLALVKTESEIVSAVNMGYVNVVIAKENVEIAKQNLANANRTLDFQRTSLEQGLINENDYKQFEIVKLTQESILTRANTAYKNAINVLKLVLDIEVDQPVLIIDGIDQILKDIKDIQKVMDVFRADKTIDYRIAENQTKADKLLLRNSYAAFLPKLSTFYSYMYNGNNNEESFNMWAGDPLWNSTQMIGISMSISLFNSFGDVAKVNQAKRNLIKSENNQKYKERELTNQFETLNNNFDFALSSVQTSKQQLVLSEKIVENEENEFKLGVSSNAALIQTKNQWYQNQSNYLNAIVQLMRVKSDLEKLLYTNNKQ